MLVDLQDSNTVEFQTKIHIYVSSISRLTCIRRNVLMAGKQLKLSAVPTVFGELVIQQNKKKCCSVYTTSATEIVVASELTAQGDEGYVPNIEAVAEIEISNLVQREKEFLSDTKPTGIRLDITIPSGSSSFWRTSNFDGY
ncbi:uncharacterized protein [Temnothorax longispinosus]|uniref:Uncharacterized protein n=1 Tax=Temnothorax longispinosus TaxID=300112 RepID=A0A4V3SAU4_9HYME|nr:hypothetical protein DBV15_12735 [Temnothorax longispinosus]